MLSKNGWLLGLCWTEGCYLAHLVLFEPRIADLWKKKQIENFIQVQILLPVSVCMFQKKQLASVKHTDYNSGPQSR